MHFNEQIFNECEDNTDFSGTFRPNVTLRRSVRLCVKISLLKAYLEPCQEFIDSLGGRDECIFLHVRRVIQTLLDVEERSGLIRWCKNTTHSAKADYYVRSKNSQKTNKS